MNNQIIQDAVDYILDSIEMGDYDLGEAIEEASFVLDITAEELAEARDCVICVLQD